MKKLTLAELEHHFRNYNETHDQDKPAQSAVIVFKPFESGWDKNRDYSEAECSYRVWNNNRRFQHGKISNSLFGNCLDGKDVGVRLDWYIGEWVVDYCYLEEV